MNQSVVLLFDVAERKTMWHYVNLMVKWQLTLTLMGAQKSETETKSLISVSISCCFANLVYVAPNSFILIPTDSSPQCQTTGLLIDRFTLVISSLIGMN